MEAERVEQIEAELDRVIERRAREARDANVSEELWKSSARVRNEKRRRELSAEWYAHHVALSGVHRRLAEEHEAKALALLGAGGGAS